jgi:tetratricopeptide (TPR) repeat protein
MCAMRAGAAALSFLLLSSAIAPTIARAEASAEPPETPKSPNQIKAEAHYKRARELYQLGRYREAIAQLEAALKLDPKGAELLYNLGLVHEKLGDAEEAIEAYRRYLKVLGPHADPEEKKKIEGAIRRLEGAKSDLKAREAKKLEHRFTPLSAGLLVTSGIALGASVVFGIAALGDDKKAKQYLVTESNGLGGRQDLVSSSKRDAWLTDVFGGLALVAGGTALALYFTSSVPRQDNPSDTPVARASLRVLPNAGGGSLRLEVAF